MAAIASECLHRPDKLPSSRIGKGTSQAADTLRRTTSSSNQILYPVNFQPAITSKAPRKASSETRLVPVDDFCRSSCSCRLNLSDIYQPPDSVSGVLQGRSVLPLSPKSENHAKHRATNSFWRAIMTRATLFMVSCTVVNSCAPDEKCSASKVTAGIG